MFVTLLLAAAAWAQDTPTALNPGINAQIYRPSIDAVSTMWTDDSGFVQEKTGWGLRLGTSYVHNPLIYTLVDGETDESVTWPIVGPALNFDLIAHVTLAQRIRVGVDLPVYAFAAGAYRVTSGGLGDLAIDARGTLLDRREAPVGLALGVRLSLPTGVVANLRYGGVAYEFQAIVDRQFDRFYLGLNVGTRGFPKVELENIDWGPQFLGRLGMGYHLTDFAGLSLDAATNVNYGGGDGLSGVPVELMVGGWGRPNASGPLVIRGGLGRGVSPGLGTSQLRASLLLSYEPAPALDSDKDGILDKVDECKDQAEDLDGFKDGDGCPEEDNDQDGIVDANDACDDEPEDIDKYKDQDGCPDPSTRVKVRITDPEGVGIPDVLAELIGTDERHVDTAGTFEVPLHPGRFEMLAEADGYKEARLTIDVPAQAEFEVVRSLEPLITMGKLKIQVKTADNKPVSPDFQVDGGKSLLVPASGAETSLKPGPHQITVRAEGYAPTTVDVEISTKVANSVVVLLQPSKASLAGTQIIIRDSIYFETGKAVIKSQSFGLLDEIAQILRDHTELERLRIEGHTDKRGSDATNLRLSQERATSVRDYLVKKGIDKRRLVAVGYGETVPLDEAENEAAYERNRRVDFFVEKQAQAKPK